MEQKIEIWKPVKNFEGLYSVSSLGRVMNVKRNNILKCSTNGKYKTVLIGGRKYKRYYLHRLVAITFIPIPEYLKCFDYSELEVDHIDGDLNNNAVSNLRWCTKKQNCNYELHKNNLSKSLKGKTPWNKGVKNWMPKESSEIIKQKAKDRLKDKTNHPTYNTGKRVVQIKDGVIINIFPNCVRAAEALGCSCELIRKCCNHKPHCKTAYGFIWRYADEVDKEKGAA